MLKRWAYPAIAFLIAGCGGGGGSSAGSPALPGTGNQTAPAGKMVISIPNATASQSIGKRDISPAAASISIVVTSGTTSMPAQIADISASSPNCTGGTSARTCTIPVQALPGTDTFAVTIFDGPNATGHQLSSGSAQSSVVPGAPFSVNITLQGVISSLAFFLPKDGNGDQDYPGPKAGEPGSGIGTVVAKDASGNFIVGPYLTPISITSSSSSISVSPSTLNASGPVQFTYDGGVAPVTLTASTGSGSSLVTTTQVVNPQTNVVYYQTPTLNAVRIYLGPDGMLYVMEFGPEVSDPFLGFVPSGPGKIARFNPISKTFTGEVTVGKVPISMTWAPDGSIWDTNVLDLNQTGSIGHVTGFSTFSAFPTPSQPNSRPRDITVGSDGNLWYVESRGGGSPVTARVVKFAAATPASMTEYPLATSAHAQSILAGPDGNLWVTDSNNLTIDKVTTAGAVTAFPIPGNGGQFSFTNLPRYMATGSDGMIYMTDIGNQANAATNGVIWKVTPATGAMTSIVPPSTYAAPDFITAGPAGTLYFVDLGLAAIGTVSLSSGQTTEFPVGDCAGTGVGPQGVAAGPDGSLWFANSACAVQNPPSTQIGHLILAPGWRVFPTVQTINLSPTGTASQQLLGIAESGSDTFTVTSSNAGVASVTPVNPRNFIINGISNGTATITISDGHISITRTVVVSSATATVQSTARRIP